MSDQRGIEREGSRGEQQQHRGDRTFDSGCASAQCDVYVHARDSGDVSLSSRGVNVIQSGADVVSGVEGSRVEQQQHRGDRTFDSGCASAQCDVYVQARDSEKPSPTSHGVNVESLEAEKASPTSHGVKVESLEVEKRSLTSCSVNVEAHAPEKVSLTSRSVHVQAGDSEKLIRLAAASVIGREHVRLSRNNQDAAATNTALGFSVAVVCDGCSAGSASEVGGKIAARFLAHTVPSLASTNGLNAALAEHAADALLAHLKVVIGEQPLLDIVSSQLLFTFLCAVTDGAKTLVFGIGDGVVWVDGTAKVLESGPQNAPAYLAYRLVPEIAEAEVVIHHFGPAARVCLATDGLIPVIGEIASLFADEVVWRNPAQLQRRLNVLATRKDPRLDDDATLALLELVAR